MKKILVATIGTRDLMFQVSSGEWFNLGDDQMKTDVLDIMTEHIEVTSDLNLSDLTTHRELTKHLFDNLDLYLERLKPVIFGQIFQERAQEIEKVYLIGTDQNESVQERIKDTIYSSKIIRAWLNQNFPDIHTEIIPLGIEGENPSDFEQMFRWWTKIWKTKIIPKNEQKLWVCLKGGVGQTSEASRISGLGTYERDIEFFEFEKTPWKNRQGIPSKYTGPFLGTNYLWNRVQKEALELLKNYNYLAVQGILAPYFQQDTQGWGATPNLLKGAIAWNQGQFDTFFKCAKSNLDNSQKSQEKEYWWQAYEQGYTAVIRLKQDNTTEAMLHSFRTIEGLIYEWMQRSFRKYININGGQFPVLSKSILTIYPDFQDLFDRFDRNNRGTIKISGEVQAALVLARISEAHRNEDFMAWNSQPARDARNRLSHRLGGIDKRELFLAWGQDIHNAESWQKRLLCCINLIVGKNFASFRQASLFPTIHYQLQKKIEDYQV